MWAPIALFVGWSHAAEPWGDAERHSADAADRAEGVARLYGTLDRGPVLGDGAPSGALRWAVAPRLDVAVGDAVPVNNGGHLEPGALSTRTGLTAAAAWGPAELLLSPEIELDAPFLAVPRIDEAWLGVRAGGWFAGAGRRHRWVGHARHGALVRGTDARPPWAVAAGGAGTLPGKAAAAGVFGVGLEVGVLDRPRTDVSDPGVLLLGLHWAPLPAFELGLLRQSVFGGVGRPVDVGQLLLPTEPHVYEDPDKLLADQDEMAAVEARVTLPLAAWAGGPWRHLEIWWTYAGEDVIGRSLGPIPYPSLAGVGNLGGAELGVGRLTLSAEWSRLMDDTFRWYVGHRVYHLGFTQEGRPLGHWGGTDSSTWWGAAAWDAGAWRARVWVDGARRVGVIEARNDKLFTFQEDERMIRGGAEVGWSPRPELRVELGASVESRTNEEFVPGLDAVHARGWARGTWTFAGQAR